MFLDCTIQKWEWLLTRQLLQHTMTTPTLESYSAIQDAYDYFNRNLFDGKLPSCLITYQRQKRIMGYVSFRRWVNDRKEYVDELAINPEYFANYPTIEICQTLCHEMVHIWQAHFGQPGRRGYHNKEWCHKMIAIGLMPSTTGKPGGDKTGEKVGDYILTNGAFVTVCKSLLEDGFQLHWIDRYPVYREDLPIVTYAKSGKVAKLDPMLNILTSDAKSTTKKVDKTIAASLNTADDRETESFALSEIQGGNPSSTKPTNRSHRHKYQCSHCGVRLWGKPGLNVICGECSIQLVELT